MKSYAHKTAPFRDEIFRLIEQGVPYNEIARRFGVGRATLWELRKSRQATLESTRLAAKIVSHGSANNGTERDGQLV